MLVEGDKRRQSHQDRHFVRKRMKLLKKELQLNARERRLGIWLYPKPERLPR
jgi:hypothetical protein